MHLKIGVLCTIFVLIQAEKDGKRWVWSDNQRSESRNGNDVARYDVFENEAGFNPDGYNEAPLRPSYPGDGPYNRPPVLNQRPGGVYGGGGAFGGGYGEGQGVATNFYPEERPQGVLTGPVPSWIKQGPFKNFDKCKCAERFNCNTPGISYGHCDAGKQYCCYATNPKDQIGEPLPSAPVHSIENGILAGPGGPVDFIPGVNVRPRPPQVRPGGYLRPGGGFVRPGGGGFGITSSGTLGATNTYSPENGVLVGPGGPFDRPFAGGYGRSAKV